MNYLEQLLKDIDVNKETINEVLDKHNITPNGLIKISVCNSKKDFANLCSMNMFDAIKDIEKYITLKGFKCTDQHTFILDAYYAKNNFMITSDIDPENRGWVYDYLVKNNKQDSITFGLNQEHDIKLIKSGYDLLDLNLDFVNWDVNNLSIFDDEKYRYKLLSQLLSQIAFNDGLHESVVNIIKSLFLNHNGLDIIQLAFDTFPDDIFECIMYNVFVLYNIVDIRVLQKLSMYTFNKPSIVYTLIKMLQHFNYSLFAVQYINIDSVINFIKETNKNKSSGYVLQYYQIDDIANVYRNNITNIHDDRLAYEYENDKNFTLKPLLFKFKSILERFKNTGDFSPSDLLMADIQKHEYADLVDLLLKAGTTENIESMIKMDKNYTFYIFRENKLKYEDTVKLINKFPELLVYYHIQFGEKYLCKNANLN